MSHRLSNYVSVYFLCTIFTTGRRTRWHTCIVIHNQWVANFRCIHIWFVQCILATPRTRCWTNAGSKWTSSELRMMFRCLIAIIKWISCCTGWNAWGASTGTHLWHIRSSSTGNFLETRTRTKAFTYDSLECKSKIFRK